MFCVWPHNAHIHTYTHTYTNTHIHSYKQLSHTQVCHTYLSPSHVSFLPFPFRLHRSFVTFVRSWHVGSSGPLIIIFTAPQVPIYLRLYLPIYLPIHLPIYLPIYLCIYLSTYTYLPIYPLSIIYSLQSIYWFWRLKNQYRILIFQIKVKKSFWTCKIKKQSILFNILDAAATFFTGKTGDFDYLEWVKLLYCSRFQSILGLFQSHQPTEAHRGLSKPSQSLFVWVPFPRHLQNVRRNFFSKMPNLPHYPPQVAPCS